MSGKGGKGKGKTRGGALSAQRRSRSRNTTPASTSAFSENAHFSADHYAYDLIYERFVDNSSNDIPSSASLSDLKLELQRRETFLRDRSRDADTKIRKITSEQEQRYKKEDKDRAVELDQEKRRKAVDDDDKRDRKPDLDKAKADRKKKDKFGDTQRPPAVGAHQPTSQALSDVKGDSSFKMKKRKVESPAGEKSDKYPSSSPAKSRSSDPEIQPLATLPYMVFEPLEDDPTVYEIPEHIPPETSYEERAKLFSVARFPASDLADLGPGDPPALEESAKVKPANQVAMNTFNTYIDPYFRSYTEEDLGFLRERGDRIAPYILPALGRHYTEVWADEDNTNFSSPAPPPSGASRNPNVPRGNPDNLTDETLEKEDVSLGPLLSRVMGAILPEEPEGEPSNNDNMEVDSTPQPSAAATTMPESSQPGWRVATGRSDYATLEDRIKREMRYIGLIGPSTDPDFKAREDDEVSARLRTLQAQLREQSVLNGARKARIAEILKEQLAHQEYATILDDLDKQVEQAYSKRTRNMKATKKKKVVPNGVGVAQARVGIGEAARTLMERRKRWMGTIGPVFDEGITRMPEGTIFDGLEELIEKEKQGGQEEE